MTSFRGQASWAKMTSPGGKLTTLACHPTKGVNKAEEPAYLSTNVGQCKLIDSKGFQNRNVVPS